MQVSKYTSQVILSSRGLTGLISLEDFFQTLMRVALTQLTGELENIVASDFTQSIPLTLRLQGNRFNYRSAIAFSLGRKQTEIAPKLAKQLAHCLKQQLASDFVEIKVVSPAWLELTLTVRGVQQWLEDSLAQVTVLAAASSRFEVTSLSQYVIDRCVQLLQLGIEENIISEEVVTVWGEKLPDLQFWGEREEDVLSGEDWKFLYEIVKTVDGLEKFSSVEKWQKLAHALSLEFDRFYRYCRIFDRQQPHFPQIAIIRLNLIAITHHILCKIESSLSLV